MKTAFLRLVGLTATDHKQIEVFLRFTGRTDSFQWIATAGDLYDLQLESAPAGGRADVHPPSSASRPPGRAWILDRDQAAPDAGSPVLRRPLQLDAFEALLRMRELELARAVQAAAAPVVAERATTVAPRRSDATSRAEPEQTVAAAQRPGAPRAAGREQLAAATRRPEAAPPAGSTEAAATAPRVAAPAVPGAGAPAPAPATMRAFVDDARHTYRLKRWPASELLRGQPKYVRMLGFLSNRPLSLARLAMLSGIDETGCRDLLSMLDQRGLLVRGKDTPDPRASVFADTVPAGRPASARAGAPARVPEPASAGLFSRLRQRLGLFSGT